MLEKTEGRRRGQQRLRWLDGTTNTINMNLGKRWEKVRDKEAWNAAVCAVTRVKQDLANEQQRAKKIHEYFHEFKACRASQIYKP